jgi:plasmid stabilization system protein ParE
VAAKVLLAPTAQCELDEAMRWYDSREPGLGIDLACEVDRCLERISQNPTLYALVRKNYRRAPVNRFPYSVFYEHAGEAVVIYAVFHASQDPEKLDRLLP